ncbi:unnamed protein product [Nezara viridula]|uniref:Xaa-Pro aminopeptidase 1 n=1 Tax=Nezara viridula TaxID=85310 RepID=A0A9P0HU54_NEZVI|nr:unnamed protein product [Nezara viridula]
MVRKRCGLTDEPPPNRANTTERLVQLRAEMRRSHSVQGSPIDAYLITGSDAHQNEFVADKDRRLEYISGFTGDIGSAVITLDKAALWTIDLYISQANEEIPCDWLLMNQSVPVAEWLAGEVQSGRRVGADSKLISNSQWEILAKQLWDVSLYFIPIKNNLVDINWSPKPNHTHHEAIVHPIEYAGVHWYHKVAMVRDAMKIEGCDSLVVTALDEIAWLLNIRARDIPYYPVLSSYVILTKDQIYLFAHTRKIGTAVKDHLRIEGCFASNCVRLRPYDSILDDIATMAQKWKTACLPGEHLLTPGVSRAVFFTVPPEKRRTLVSPIARMKAEKNEVERKGMHTAHLKDAVAFCEAMSYIEKMINKGEEMDEIEIAELLDEARRAQLNNEGISFKTIVAFGKNGAFPHYEPKNTTVLMVDKTNLLLIDSGAQYLEGTTDVSRTFHFGRPTAEQKEMYTRVLMGLIDLASLTFPASVTLSEIDVMARAPLWSVGQDYNHGTGHGIGAFLSVHEGPILVSRHPTLQEVYKEGYFFSDEPGYYKEDHYGIRLENILEVISVNKTDAVEKYLAFKTVTLIPFEPKLINLKMLSPNQVKWLNDYYMRISNEVGAELKRQGRMDAFHWMISKVKMIPERAYAYGSASRVHNKLLCISSMLLASLIVFLQRTFLCD